MIEQLQDLRFGLYGYGKVLANAGLFVLRGDAADFHYIPTETLWSAFSGKPDLDDVLFGLHELVFGMAHERMDWRIGGKRQEWAVELLRALGATDDGLVMLRMLIGLYIGPVAPWIVAWDRM